MEQGGGLLDEALGHLSRRFVLLEDCVDTSAAFVLHHILKRSLSLSLPTPPPTPSFLLPSPTPSLTTIASSEDPVAIWLHRGTIIDSFFLTCLWTAQVRKSDEGKNSDCGLIALYGKIQKTISALAQENNCVTVMIDDISLMEVAAKGSTNLVLDFLHYCHTLISESGCSLIMLNHEDIYSGTAKPTLILQMEYLADILIRAEPLATGLASDVHGQVFARTNVMSLFIGRVLGIISGHIILLTVQNRGIYDRHEGSRNKVSNFQFKVKENGVDYFYPGSKT